MDQVNRDAAHSAARDSSTIPVAEAVEVNFDGYDNELNQPMRQ